ncbi:MAG: M1 family aminopeptidase [Bacteroidia bacterium]
MVFCRFCPFIGLVFIAFVSFSQSDLENIAKSERMRYESKALFKKSLLTEGYDVIYQRLELDIRLDQRWVYGKITTGFKPLKPAFNLLQFDLEDYLKVDSVIFKYKKVVFTHSNKLITIQLSNNVNIGVADSVTVYYQGNPGLNNPYNSFVFDAHNKANPHPIAWTLSEPYGSKGWWPCKESLSDKIDSLDVVVKVKKGNKAASNGVLIVEKQINDSQEIYHWRHRYPIATYLVGVAVTNYVAYTDYMVYPGNDTLPIVNYVYPESEAEARIKTPETLKMMHLFDSLFGAYPFKKEKYGHAQWNWGGGMEHQTMSFMVHFNFNLVAHELAHQWFGDWATCGSWEDLWLNEGFATYLTALCHENLISKQDFQNMMAATRSNIVKEDGGSVFVNDTATRSRLFSGRLTYDKGSFVLHMLRWNLGDRDFFEGVKNYLTKPGISYGFGTTTDLKKELEKASGQNLTEFFKDWYYGEGHPNYDITWSHVGNHIAIRIKQTPSHSSVSFFNIPLPFIIHGKTKDSAMILDPLSKDNTFTVDLNFVPQSVEFDPNVWILCKSTVLKIRPTNSPEIQLFPVPVGNTLSIYAYRGSIESVTIYDMMGRLVLIKDFVSEEIIKDSHELEVNKLSGGIYIVKIATEAGTAIQRIIKK